MTALELSILIHYHMTSNRPYAGDGSPNAIKQSIKRLFNEGLLVIVPPPIDGPPPLPTYQITALGSAHVTQLKQLPFPTVGHIDHKGELIKS